uniref:Kinesin-like protein n=1 Tax=Biomphalaria glabrata TaxID=6526 RepID=A0A2C9JIG8_BIOGL
MKSQRGKSQRKQAASPSQSEPVEVYCRIRPIDDPGDTVCVKPIGDSLVQLIPPEISSLRNGVTKEYQYTFRQVFDETASQKAVFDQTALPLVEDLVAGKNGLLFTYGVTGSGKTYTMTGEPQDQGILPRCLDVLFNSIDNYQAKKYVFRPDRMNRFEVQTEADAMMERQRREIMPNLTTPSKASLKRPESGERICDPTKVDTVEEDNNYAVFVSYIEIYNNYVYDLLEELPYNSITGYKPPQTKILRTDSGDNMYVHNCTEVEVKQSQDAIDVFYKGQRRRKVAHTALNAESSRSHSVFNIRLVQAPLDERGEEVVQDSEKICVSQLSLVDLAGSERSNRTKNSGDRLKEAGNINQSLMVLRNCLEVLRENQKTGASKMVPYRDSRLTHLFKNFFDGDGKVRMIVCVNPKMTEYDETIHVMKFAEMTQEVLITKSQQSNKFDLGLTPGRRHLHELQLENAVASPEIMNPPPLPSMLDFTFGPPFPLLEVDLLEERESDIQDTACRFTRGENRGESQIFKIQLADLLEERDIQDTTYRFTRGESQIFKIQLADLLEESQIFKIQLSRFTRGERLDLEYLTLSSSKSRQPVVNPRYHRRSKSSGSAEQWLEHKPADIVETNTIFQPQMTKKKSVTKLDVKDTKTATKYVLTHQEQDSSDELVTKLIKGDVIPTLGGGAAVVFHDVETLKQVSPGSRKRRSPTTPRYDPALQWTDTEERCSVALEGHKRSRTTNL